MYNILHVIESLEFGGAEKVVVHLANKLCLNHNVLICVTKRKGELISELDSRIKVVCLDGKEGNDYSIPFKLSRILKNNNIDIVHTHDWGIHLEAVLASLLYRRSRLIHTVHGRYMSYSDTKSAKIKKFLRNILEKIASLRVYKIIPVSRSIQSYIETDLHINTDRLLTIHNGIEGHAVINFDDTAVAVTRLITVGRLAAVKNHKLMIDAVKLAVDNKKNITLTIVGDGPEYDDLVNYTQSLDLSEYVFFKGFRTDIDKLLSEHHVFILSSDYEGVSIALLEAMSKGMPVISTSVGGIPETIINNHNGILVDKGDSVAMSNAIALLASDFSTIKSMGSNAYQYFLKNFHENVVLEKYNTLYKECMK